MQPKTKPPRPPPPLIASKSAPPQPSSTGVKRSPLSQEKPPIPPKPVSPFRLRGHPRFFQLSHEYEHIANRTSAAEHLPLKRCNSDEEMYAMPLRVRILIIIVFKFEVALNESNCTAHSSSVAHFACPSILFTWAVFRIHAFSKKSYEKRQYRINLAAILYYPAMFL